jgi:hypothetical protein
MESKSRVRVAYDNRLNVDADEFVMLHASTNVQNQTENASSVSASSFVITVNVPSSDTIVSRSMMLNVTFDFSITTDVEANDTAPLQPYWSGFRAYPLQSVIGAITLSIDAAQYSTGSYNYLTKLHLFENDLNNRSNALTLTMQDRVQYYGPKAEDIKYVGSALAQRQDNPIERTRSFTKISADGKSYEANFPTLVLDGNTIAAAANGRVVTGSVTLSEMLYLSPLLGDNSDDVGGIVRANKIQLTVNFATLSRLFELADVDDVVDFKAISVTPTAASLSLQYLAIPSNYVIPPVIKTRFYHITPSAQSRQSPLPAFDIKNPGNNQAIFQQSGYLLSTIPRKIMIYVGVDPNYNTGGQLAFKETDSVACLDPQGQNQISIRIGNMDKMAQVSTEQLFMMSRRNGYAYTYENFVSTMGSVIMLDTARDLGLADYQVSGLLDKTLLSVTLQVRNKKDKEKYAYTLFIIPIEEGVTVDTNGSRQTMIGLYSKQQVLESGEFGGFLGGRYSTMLDGVAYQPNSMGGSFMSTVQKLAEFFKGSKVLSNLASRIPVVGKDVQELLVNKGYGINSPTDPMLGGKQPRRRRTGEKKITQAQIRDALRGIVS